MTDRTIVFSTVVCSFISGAVVLFSTYTSRYLDRRKRHLNEHKDNFALIDRALKEIMNKVWLFNYRYESPRLNYIKWISPETPKLTILGITLYNPEIGDKPEELVKVDSGLYNELYIRKTLR